MNEHYGGSESWGSSNEEHRNSMGGDTYSEGIAPDDSDVGQWTEPTYGIDSFFPANNTEIAAQMQTGSPIDAYDSIMSEPANSHLGYDRPDVQIQPYSDGYPMPDHIYDATVSELPAGWTSHPQQQAGSMNDATTDDGPTFEFGQSFAPFSNYLVAENTVSSSQVPTTAMDIDVSFHFNPSYFATYQRTDASSASSSAISPCTGQATVPSTWTSSQLENLHDSPLDPSSEALTSLLLPSFEEPVREERIVPWNSVGLMMNPTEEPWSIVNTRQVEGYPASSAPGVTDPAMMHDDSSSPFSHTPSAEGGNSLSMYNVGGPETNLGTEIDEMISNYSTIRAHQAAEPGIADPADWGSASARHEPGIRFLIREDTPSRETDTQQSRDVVMLVNPRSSLSVPGTNAAGSEVSSPSSGGSLLGPHSPMSATSSSEPPILVCGVGGCLVEFTGKYRRGNRRRHQRLYHEGNQAPFMCEAPSCTRTFKRTDARTKHYHKHHSSLAAAAIPRHRTAASSARSHVREGAWPMTNHGS